MFPRNAVVIGIQVKQGGAKPQRRYADIKRTWIEAEYTAS
jgi:hypothetical protein